MVCPGIALEWPFRAELKLVNGPLLALAWELCALDDVCSLMGLSSMILDFIEADPSLEIMGSAIVGRWSLGWAAVGIFGATYVDFGKPQNWFMPAADSVLPELWSLFISWSMPSLSECWRRWPNPRSLFRLPGMAAVSGD